MRPRHHTNQPTAIQMKSISLRKMRDLVKKKRCELFAVRVRPNNSKITVSQDFADIVDEFSDFFLDELPNELSSWRDINVDIKLKFDQPSPVRPVIQLSTEELRELKRQLQMMLKKSLLRPSSSPYGAPVCFVKKKTGDLRMVCDYRALNKIKIPDSDPLPFINEALDQVAGAKVFSQIDLIGAYHQMTIKEEECHKISIRSRFGCFEWCVLYFGPTNAPASFTRLLTTLCTRTQWRLSCAFSGRRIGVQLFS